MTTINARYRLPRDDFTLDVDVQLPTRGITGLFGRSGAGKTTLLRCIAGLEKTDGRFSIGADTWQDSEQGIWRKVEARQIGYVFQEPRLFDHLSVRGNIDYGRRRRAPDADTSHIVDLLDLAGLLARRPHELSGGEAQRVAIARALSCAPKLVLMDEPLASLDQARKDEVLPYLDRLHAETEVPVIYVSHNLDEVSRLCDHLVHLASGRVVSSGDLRSVLVDVDTPLAVGDHASSIIEGNAVDIDEEYGLARVAFSGGELWVPAVQMKVGKVFRLRVRASDVSLCRTKPDDSTILNILPARIETIRDDAAGSALVRLVLGSDYLLARITRPSS